MEAFLEERAEQVADQEIGGDLLCFIICPCLMLCWASWIGINYIDPRSFG